MVRLGIPGGAIPKRPSNSWLNVSKMHNHREWTSPRSRCWRPKRTDMTCCDTFLSTCCWPWKDRYGGVEARCARLSRYDLDTKRVQAVAEAGPVGLFDAELRQGAAVKMMQLFRHASWSRVLFKGLQGWKTAGKKGQDCTAKEMYGQKVDLCNKFGHQNHRPEYAKTWGHEYYYANRSSRSCLHHSVNYFSFHNVCLQIRCVLTTPGIWLKIPLPAAACVGSAVAQGGANTTSSTELMTM